MSARRYQPAAGSDWQSVYSESKETIPAFGVVEIIPKRLRRNDDTGLTTLVGKLPFEGAESIGRHDPPLIAFAGERSIKPRRNGPCTFGRLAVAAINSVDVASGDMVFACAGRPTLEEFRTYDDGDGNTIHTLDHRIVGVFKVVSEVERDQSLYQKGVLALVYRVTDFRWLVKAFEDVPEETAGVFEVHSFANRHDGSADWPSIVGSEDQTNYRIRAFNRWGYLSAGDWAIVQPLDGVLSTIGGAGDGGSCSCGNTWILAGHGNISGGASVFDFTVNSVTEPVTLEYGDTAAEVQAKLRAHSEVNPATSSVVCALGPWPNQEIHVLFSGVLEDLSEPFDNVNNTSIEPAEPGGGGLRIGSFQPAAVL